MTTWKSQIVVYQKDHFPPNQLPAVVRIVPVVAKCVPALRSIEFRSKKFAVNLRVGITIALLCVVSAPALSSQESEEVEPEEQELADGKESGGLQGATLFGGRASIAVQIEDDNAISMSDGRLSVLDSVLEGAGSWKQRLRDEHGLELGIDLATLSQWVSGSMTDIDDAWAGVFRTYGRWAVRNRNESNTGFIGFKVEHRNALGGKIPPKLINQQIGYIGFTDIVFSDDGNLISELSYQQRLGKNDQAAIVAGRFDPNNFMDVLGCCSPWTTFSNLSHLLNLSLSLPDASWGIGAGSWLGEKEQWYVSGTINDANGTIRSGLDWFTGGAEFFKNVEVGWSPSRERRLYTKVSMTLWHVDERVDGGLPESQGVVFSANKTWNDTWMGFVKAGISDGKATLYDELFMVGFGRVFHQTTDRIGMALAYTNPPDESLSAEKSLEVFYKFQLAKSLQLTASYQYIKDPAFNTEESSIDVFGLRLRFVL
jgi:porin